MNQRGLSLSVKVGIAVLLVSSMPAAVATWVAYSQSRSLLQESIGQNLASQADRLADELDTFHNGFVIRASSMAAFQPVVESARIDAPEDERARARAIMETVLIKDQRMQGITLIGGDGLVRISTDEKTEGKKATQSWYETRSSDALAGMLYVPPGRDPSGAVIEYSAPVTGNAMVVISVRAEAFWAMVRQLNDRVYKSSYVVVLDSDGVRIGHGSHPQLIFTSTGTIPSERLERMVTSQRFGARTRELLGQPADEQWEHTWATSATGGDRTLQRFAPNDIGQGERYATSRRLRSVPWTVVSVVPEDALTLPVAELLETLVWRIGLILGAAFLISLFLAQRAFDPLKRLVDAASQLSGGSTPKPIPVSGQDEIGELVKQFNGMVVATANARQELETRVKERTRELTTANQELLVQQEELKAQQEELERKNREVERANQLKSAFLANMSHELRTPLNSVIGFSELLNDDIGASLDARHRKYLSDVNASGKHLLRLINDILDLSKIEAGHLELDVEAIAAGTVVAEARTLVGGAALTSRVTIIDELKSQQRVMADPEKLRQVLVNLLSNAVKFSPAGSEVHVGCEDVAGGVRFSVRDNGPGIDPSYMKRLFEPFVQGENPLTKRHQGTGLGLAISRRVLERHGSSLQVESVPGRGAHFWFVLSATASETKRSKSATTVLLVESDLSRAKRLREALIDAGYEVASPVDRETVSDAARRVKPAVLVVAPDEEAQGIDSLKAVRADPQLRRIPVVLTTAARAAGVLAKPLEPDEIVVAVRRAIGRGTGTVLVVDDDPRALELITAVLTPRGYTVETATGAQEALTKMRRAKPDVVLTDLLMPEVSGFELVETLAGDQALKSVPVLVLTALDLDEEQRRRLRRHVVATARKGDITALEVVETVAKLTRAEVEPGLDGKSVLVVDDHDLNRQLARALLEKRGFTVLEASGGQEGVELTQQLKPTLVLMDLAMPQLDGFAALQRIRADRGLDGIPVVALTAMAMKSDQEAVQRAGFDGYLTKPIDAVRLDAELARVIAARHATTNR